MGLYSDFCKSMAKYYEDDEIALNVIRRDYYSMPLITGLYLHVKPKYLPLSVCNLIAELLIIGLLSGSVFYSTIFLFGVSFTLAAFHLQILLLMIFNFIMLCTYNLARPELNILHREMISEVFEYEEEDRVFLDTNYAEIRKDNLMLLIGPILAVIGAGNALLIGPVIDSTYGTFSYNGTELSGASWTLPVPLVWFPISLEQPALYYCALACEFIIAYYILSNLGLAGYIFINITQTLCLHIKYLSFNVEKIEGRAERMLIRHGAKDLVSDDRQQLYSDPRFIRCYQRCLKRSFQHHQSILRWMNCFQKFASIPIALAYFTGSVVIALNLMSIKTGLSLPGTLISSGLFGLAEIGFMALLSTMGQRITDLSEDLRFKLYSTKWYYCPKIINLDMEIFQELTQRPLAVRGFGIIMANNDTFSNVMNSAYSYYNLIMAF